MKVVITGHTSGIGKAIYETLSSFGHEVIGLSRSNGYDIKDHLTIIAKILESQADVFINNAYLPEYQTKLIRDLYAVWKSDKKQIINIGSCAALIEISDEDYYLEYAKEKREQRELCLRINKYLRNSENGHPCKLTNINLHYVNTNFPTKYDKTKYPNLETREVANVVNMIISQYANDFAIEEITVHSTRRA